MGALKVEPWALISGINREQIAREEGIQTMLDILDQKYGRDRKQQKINYLDEFFRVDG